MFNRIMITAAAIIGLLALAGGPVMADGVRTCTGGTCPNVTGGGDSGPLPINFAQLEGLGQSSLVIGDINDTALLSSIIDDCIEEDPNKPEEHVRTGGGGGGSAGSSSGLFASNPYGGSGSAGGLMPTPAPRSSPPQSTGPAAYGDTLFSSAPAPVDGDGGETIIPSPYVSDGTTAVPEPTTIVMLGLGSLTLLRRKR